MSTVSEVGSPRQAKRQSGYVTSNMNELDEQLDICEHIKREAGDDLNCSDLAKSVESGKISLDDMKDTILDYVEPGETEPLTLYTADGCPSCKKAKEILGPDIEKGTVDVVDISEDGDMGEFLTEHFEGVPVLAAEHDGKLCEVNIVTGEIGDCVEPFQEE